MSDVFDVVRDTVVAREPSGVLALTAAYQKSIHMPIEHVQAEILGRRHLEGEQSLWNSQGGF